VAGLADDQFFFRHPLLADYDYYWRIEPSIKLFCDIGQLHLQYSLNVKLMVAAYDPFLVMQDNKKVYGFTLSLYEYIETIPTLWDAVKGEWRIFFPQAVILTKQNLPSSTRSTLPTTMLWASSPTTEERPTTSVIVSSPSPKTYLQEHQLTNSLVEL